MAGVPILGTTGLGNFMEPLRCGSSGFLRAHRLRGGERRGGGLECCELFWDAFVLFNILLHHAPGHEVMKFFIGPQTEHFLSTAGRISRLESFIDLLKKVFKLVAFT